MFHFPVVAPDNANGTHYAHKATCHMYRVVSANYDYDGRFYTMNAARMYAAALSGLYGAAHILDDALGTTLVIFVDGKAK